MSSKTKFQNGLKNRNKQIEILLLLKERKIKEISEIADVHDGRIDLRGLKFNILRKKNIYRLKMEKESISIKESTPKFSDFRLADADFTSASFDDTIWENCEIDSCIFSNTNLRKVIFHSCHIKNSIFSNCLIEESMLGGHINGKESFLENLRFEGGSFKWVTFTFPRIENCVFACDMKEVFFGGSRIKNCEFTGKLENIFFEKQYHLREHDIRHRISLPPGNEMQNIDFSKAIFDDVIFEGGLDLTRCNFPLKQEHIFIRDGKGTFKMALEIMNRKWPSEEGQLLFAFVNGWYMDKIAAGQNQFVIIKQDLIDGFGDSLGNKFYSLLNSFQP